MADYAIHDTTLIGTSNIIRKKEGSSALIDPADYPKRINLMGMLEEKTASSASVCSFSDGADDVPMSSVIAHIGANLTGKNAVNMVKSGKNLASGGVYEYNARNMIIAPVYLRAGTYTVSFNRGVNVQYIYIRKGDTVSLVGDAYATKSNTTFFTFTADEDGYYYAQLNRTNTSDTWEDYPVTQPQIEVGSMATAYEPYAEPTSYTANLGRTVYGADVDLVSGQGSETYPAIKISDLTFVKDANCQHTFRCTNLPRKYGSGVYNIFSTAFATYTSGNSTGSNIASLEVGNDNTIFLNGGSATFYITADSSYDNKTASDFSSDFANTLLIYEASTPTDFTFDGQEIPSLLGVNNLWHDAGNTEAVYRSSGTVTPVPVVPTLIAKTITENDTYYAEDDNADGYSEVIVNVQGGSGKIIVDDLIEYPYPSNNTNVIYSSQIAAQSAAYKAFVPDVAQYWTGSGATNNYIGWKFSTPQVVNFYEIWSRNQGNQYDYLQAPKEWILQGSNDDGETWTDIDEQDFTFTDSAEKWSSAISNTTAYKWYRIFVITARDTANDTCIGYIDFKHAYIEQTPSLLSMSPSPTPSEPDPEDPEEEVEEEET